MFFRRHLHHIKPAHFEHVVQNTIIPAARVAPTHRLGFSRVRYGRRDNKTSAAQSSDQCTASTKPASLRSRLSSRSHLRPDRRKNIFRALRAKSKAAPQDCFRVRPPAYVLRYNRVSSARCHAKYPAIISPWQDNGWHQQPIISSS